MQLPRLPGEVADASPHCALAGHLVPHDPQLSLSVLRSTQTLTVCDPFFSGQIPSRTFAPPWTAHWHEPP
jgi:hypothetical protein